MQFLVHVWFVAIIDSFLLFVTPETLMAGISYSSLLWTNATDRHKFSHITRLVNLSLSSTHFDAY